MMISVRLSKRRIRPDVPQIPDCFRTCHRSALLQDCHPYHPEPGIPFSTPDWQIFHDQKNIKINIENYSKN